MEKTELIIRDGVKELYCSNPNCAGKFINQVDHFVGKKGLDVKGLSKATIEKLLDWGWIETLSDIFYFKDRHIHHLTGNNSASSRSGRTAGSGDR